MIYLRLFESTNDKKNYPIRIRVNSRIYPSGDNNWWAEDDGSDEHADWQLEFLSGGQILNLDPDMNYYDDHLTYILSGGESLPMYFTPDNLVSLTKNGDITLIYEIPEDIKTFTEELLIDLIDAGVKIEYECQSVYNRIRLRISLGTDFSWERFGGAILNYHNVLQDEYDLQHSFVNTTVLRNDEFELYKFPKNINSMQFNIDVINTWYK